MGLSGRSGVGLSDQVDKKAAEKKPVSDSSANQQCRLRSILRKASTGNYCIVPRFVTWGDLKVKTLRRDSSDSVQTEQAVRSSPIKFEKEKRGLARPKDMVEVWDEFGRLELVERRRKRTECCQSLELLLSSNQPTGSMTTSR